MIRLEGVSKSYAQGPVLTELSFELAQGERLAVVGPSGSGKTTLLRLLAGFELPDKGTIFLSGCPASRPGWGLPPYERQIGLAFQVPALWPHMTTAQNILFGLNGMSRTEKQQRLEELASALKIEKLLKRYPGKLSGGEARRVGLARALAPRSPILLLDEPLTNLDEDLKTEIIGALMEWIGAYRPTMLFVTHDAGEAVAISNRRIELGSKI